MKSSNVHIACQTITWGENQKDRLDEVFRVCHEAGYEGVEIGFRHIKDIPPAGLQRMLQTHNLELVGSHIGGNLQNPGQARGEQDILNQVLDHIIPAGTRRLMYSGLRFENETQFQRDLESLRQGAVTCKKRGVEFLYHNHDWELAHDQRILKALIERPEIHFCPDIGWLKKGGADPLAVLELLAGRIGAIHLKDIASTSPGLDAVLLGQGIAPLREAAAWAARRQPGAWIIAEQDSSVLPTEQTVRLNAQFMKSL